MNKLNTETIQIFIKQHGFGDLWPQYKSQWKQIQLLLLPPGYRLCPICGIIIQRRFKSHLLKHNIMPKLWYDDLYNYKSTPKCPVCKTNKLLFSDKQLIYQHFCSKKCANIYSKHICRDQHYGCDAFPDNWTDEQIKNRGYIGRDDPKYIHKVKLLKFGKDSCPSHWTDEQIKNRGYTGRDDPKYIEQIMYEKQLISNRAANAGKANMLKNGSNFIPSHWTDEQIKNRGYTGRDDPRYLALIEKKKNDCSIAGKENVRKYGFFGAPGSWTDEQIKNRGYTGRDDPRYIAKCHQKTQWSKRCGKITQEKYGCKLDGWGYKINFIYNNKLYKLDSLYELWFALTLIECNSNEQLIDNQYYYQNTTQKYNGIGARSDLRTLNKKTKNITNWEIHNINDNDGIARKQFCTELHGNIFKLISFNQIKQCIKKLKTLGYDIDEIKKQAKHFNYELGQEYTYVF